MFAVPFSHFVCVWHFLSFGMFRHGSLCRYFRVHCPYIFCVSSFLLFHWIHLISEIMRAHFQWPFSISISGHWSWIPFNIYVYISYYTIFIMTQCLPVFHFSSWILKIITKNGWNIIILVLLLLLFLLEFFTSSAFLLHIPNSMLVFFVVSFLFGRFSFRFVVFFRLKFKMFVRFDTRNAFSTTKSTLNSIQFKWHNLSYKLAKHYSIQCAFDKTDFNISKFCRKAATHRSNGPGWSSEASWHSICFCVFFSDEQSCCAC